MKKKTSISESKIKKKGGSKTTLIEVPYQELENIKALIPEAKEIGVCVAMEQKRP